MSFNQLRPKRMRQFVLHGPCYKDFAKTAIFARIATFAKLMAIFCHFFVVGCISGHKCNPESKAFFAGSLWIVKRMKAHPRAVVVLICSFNSFQSYLSQIRPIILCLRYAIHVNPTQCLVVPASSAAVVPRPPGTVNDLLSRKFQQSTCLRKDNVISR